MTYDATVTLKFDATWKPSYNSSFNDDDFIPEEHYLITAPASDLNTKQYFKLFEKFLLCVGMDPKSIRSGAMSLVFNKIREEEIARLMNGKKGPMGTVLTEEELTNLEEDV